jgi:putative endonuclease
MFYYTYVLKSKVDGKLYIGFTENLQRRTIEHNSGLVSATKTRKPLELIYFEACKNKDKALKREKYLKSGFGRKFLKDRI